MESLSQERRNIAFDCEVCGNSLQLTESSYKEFYEDHKTCLICRKDEGVSENE